MSIGRKTGGGPSRVTVPVIVAAVPGSTTAVGSGGAEGSSFCFLLQLPTVRPRTIAKARRGIRILKSEQSFLRNPYLNKRAREWRSETGKAIGPVFFCRVASSTYRHLANNRLSRNCGVPGGGAN